MFPRNADEARFFDQEMVIDRSVSRAAERLKQNTAARVIVHLAGGSRVEGTWIESDHRRISLHDAVEGVVTTTEMALVDVMAVSIEEAAARSPLVLPEDISEEIQTAMVAGALFHSGRSVAEAFQVLGLEADDTLEDMQFSQLDAERRRSVVERMVGYVHPVEQEQCGTIGGALARIRADHERRGVRTTCYEEIAEPYEGRHDERIADMQDDAQREYLRTAIGRIGMASAIDREIHPFMRRDRLHAVIAPWMKRL